jgi:hypothetical protein
MYTQHHAQEGTPMVLEMGPPVVTSFQPVRASARRESDATTQTSPRSERVALGLVIAM